MSTRRDEPTGRFPKTDWKLVRRAGARGEAGSRRALGELLEMYLPALRAHLTQTRGIPIDRAEDLLQSFASAKFLEQRLAERADASRGRFRGLVLTALEHFLVDRHRRRGPPLSDSLPALERAAAAPATPADSFDVQWARQVLRAAVDRMRAECATHSRAQVWGVFAARVLGPAIEGTPPPDYTTLVAQFGFRSPAQASNVLVTGKRMFERALRAVIAEYAEGAADVDEEIRALREILSRPRAR